MWMVAWKPGEESVPEGTHLANCCSESAEDGDREVLATGEHWSLKKCGLSEGVGQKPNWRGFKTE